MLADESVHGDVLEHRDTTRFCKDVDTSYGVPGDLCGVGWLLFDGPSVGPVLKVTKHLGIVLNHVD